MGEAKRRGTFEQREAEAVKERRLKEKKVPPKRVKMNPQAELLLHAFAVLGENLSERGIRS